MAGMNDWRRKRMVAATSDICNFGWKAVDASLKATDGNHYHLHDLCGKNGLVVAFICNHCPYVLAVIERMVDDANLLQKEGVNFVAICANDALTYPEDSFANMVKFAKLHRFTFPYLHDETQAVARAYDAICTPDFFGFNKDLELQYRGRLDEGKGLRIASDARCDLLLAMRQIAQTGMGPKQQIASMGCSIKWK